MKNRAGSKIDRLPDELVRVERYLDTHLQPVAPRPGYVDDVRQRLLASEPAPELKTSNKDLFLFGGVALVASVLALLLGYKATVALLGAMGLLNQIKKNVPARSGTSRPPVLQEAV